MRVVYAVLVVVLFASCQQEPKRKAIKVLASDSYRSALPEINNRFKALYKTEVDVEYASSAQLAQRIRNGHKADIFLTDDAEKTTELNNSSLTEGKPKHLFNGVLVWWALQNLSVDDSLSAIRSTAVKKIGLADPDSCSFGKVSELVMYEIDAPVPVFEKVKSYPSLDSTTQALIKKEVDFVFMSKAVVLSTEYAGLGYWGEINPALHLPVEHFALLLSKRNKIMEAKIQSYYSFLSGTEAAQVFEKFGFQQELEPLGLAFPFQDP